MAFRIEGANADGRMRLWRKEVGGTRKKNAKWRKTHL